MSRNSAYFANSYWNTLRIGKYLLLPGPALRTEVDFVFLPFSDSVVGGGGGKVEEAENAGAAALAVRTEERDALQKRLDTETEANLYNLKVRS